jgi:hypothetical protein
MTKFQTKVKSKTSDAPLSSGVLQRQCACGQHTIAGGTCTECSRKEQVHLQRSAVDDGQASETFVPNVVHEVLRSPGYPLDSSTRDFFEPRFDHDFSRVRVHTDSRAAESALAVNALAYTVGRNVVFGAGQYSPASGPGRRLLAHELTHVVQQQHLNASHTERLKTNDSHGADELQADRVAEQTVDAVIRQESPEASLAGMRKRNSSVVQIDGASSNTPLLQRSRSKNPLFSALSNIGGFFSSMFHGIFGFSDEALKEYLKGLEETGEIERDPDSDDMARAIVSKWMTDRTAFVLTPRLKRLLIQEMLDGPTTLSDETAILDLLETSRDDDLSEIFSAVGPDPQRLKEDLDDQASQARLIKFFAQRYKGGLEGVLKVEWEKRPYFNLKALDDKGVEQFVIKHFSDKDRDLARKILNDLRAVKKDELDFESEAELQTEIFKRLRTSQLMKESQASEAFAYPESLPEDCPGYDKVMPPETRRPNISKHARVNKEAKDYWTDVILGPEVIYYFALTPLGREHGFDAIEKLFARQASTCDKTLIHCDYLTSVIQLRAFAESIGKNTFDERVKSGAITFYLTYFGAEYITATDVRPPRKGMVGPVAPKAVSLQVMRPASEEDLLIGDHVMFWNHLAYDALTLTKGGPWRLENAVIVDKNEKGEDLFEGHGAPTLGDKTVPGTKDEMLGALMTVYNRVADPAIDLTRQVEEGFPDAEKKLKEEYPQVHRGSDGKWFVNELPKNFHRPKKFYELRTLFTGNDPEIIGLRDEINPNLMGLVERPVESRKEPLPKT